MERPGPRLFPGAGAFRRTERLRGAGVLELAIHWRDGRREVRSFDFSRRTMLETELDFIG